MLWIQDDKLVYIPSTYLIRFQYFLPYENTHLFKKIWSSFWQNAKTSNALCQLYLWLWRFSRLALNKTQHVTSLTLFTTWPADVRVFALCWQKHKQEVPCALGYRGVPSGPKPDTASACQDARQPALVTLTSRDTLMARSGQDPALAVCLMFYIWWFCFCSFFPRKVLTLQDLWLTNIFNYELWHLKPIIYPKIRSYSYVFFYRIF